MSDAAVAEFEKLSIPQQRAIVFSVQAGRETIESFAVAFVLALLFRAFIAEAFVIPTGSMAPALMGAHKDLFCQQCGQQFQAGSSLENRGEATDMVVVGGICPNCKYANPLDLVNKPEHGNFNGDRILVSKFAYMIHDPKRWDVIVFKVPRNPKQNYIKRLVGLPGETISLRHGDVFARPTGSETAPSEEFQPLVGDVSRADLGEILRKPPATLLAMKHFVYDSDHQSSALLKANFPSRLQPWRPGAQSPPEDSWKVIESEAGLTATLEMADQPEWLRYYHHWALPQHWDTARKGLSLANVDPYAAGLITDFHAYDAYVQANSSLVYRQRPSQSNVSMIGKLLGKNRGGGEYRPSFQSGEDLSQFKDSLQIGGSGLAIDGLNWVGDLIVAADLETQPEAKSAVVEIVEAGVRYQASFDLTSGRCELNIVDGRGRDESALQFGDDAQPPTASTSVLAGSRHEIRFSNADEQLMVWIDGDVLEFDRPTTFDVSKFTTQSQDRPYYGGPDNPLDASPVGLAVTGGGATVHRVQIDRDKYYIADNNPSFPINEYDLDRIQQELRQNVRLDDIQTLFRDPLKWEEYPVWQFRRHVSFELQQDQFFPMGDNSPESLDARAWASDNQRIRFNVPPSPDEDAYMFKDASYVPRDLLVGKALLVFWPHSWTEPLPFTPNVKRMKLIR